MESELSHRKAFFCRLKDRVEALKIKSDAAREDKRYFTDLHLSHERELIKSMEKECDSLRGKVVEI